MDPAVKMQLDVRQNASALQEYAKELIGWENEMKMKDTFLKKEEPVQELPPVRSKRSKPKETNKVAEKGKKSYSCDYSSWDKFDVAKACEEIEASTESESESDSKSDDDCEKGDEEKLKGNEFVKLEKWDEAIKCYSKAISHFNKNEIYFANRALCYIKKEAWEDAISDCTIAIDLKPNYVKALQRRSVAYASIGKLVKALGDLSNVVQLEPNNKQAREQINELEKKLRNISDDSKPTRKDSSKLNISSKKPLKTVERDAERGKTSQAKHVSFKDDNLQSITSTSKMFEDVDSLNTYWDVGSQGDGRVIVKPIVKPPHLRSKKPLQRISIIEVGSDERKQKSVQILTNSDIAAVVNNSISETPAVQPNDNTSFNKSNQKQHSVKLNSSEPILEPCTNKISTLDNIKHELPRTSIQFYNQWKRFKENPEEKFNLLKMIPGSKLPDIFRNSLESNLVSEILELLKQKCTSNEFSIAEYLEGLTKVPRFGALRLFMSYKDLINIKELLNLSGKSEEATETQLKKIASIYEIAYP